MSTDCRLEALPGVVRQGRLRQARQSVRLHDDLGAGLQLRHARCPRRLDERRRAGWILSRFLVVV